MTIVTIEFHLTLSYYLTIDLQLPDKYVRTRCWKWSEKSFIDHSNIFIASQCHPLNQNSKAV